MRSTPSVDVYEVLEQEYVSMYGELPIAPALADGVITEEQIESFAIARDRACRYLRKKCATSAELAAALDNTRAATEHRQSAAYIFRSAPQLSGAGRRLARRFNTYEPSRRPLVNRRILDEVFSDSLKTLRDQRLANIYANLHVRAGTPGEGRTALCISGGGIRSATFGLGIMEGLAAHHVLDNFDYLSTVSGGGYIGSWLSSWTRRDRNGIAGVESSLRESDAAATGKAEVERKLEPEAQPLRHLREYSNYLTPRLGLMSADTWTMAALYLRNVLLNWLVLLPILVFVLAIPRMLAFGMVHAGAQTEEAIEAIGISALLAGLAYIALVRPVKHGADAEFRIPWLPSDPDTRFVIVCLPLFVIAAICGSLYWVLVQAKVIALPGGVAGFAKNLVAVATIIPVFVYFLRYIWIPYSERRESADVASKWGRNVVGRFLVEGFAAGLGALVGWALLYFFATRIFPHPRQVTPNWTAYLMPFPASEHFVTAASVPLYITFAVPLVLIAFFVQASVFVGISGRLNHDYDREWWGRAGAWLLIAAFGWVAVCAIAIYGPVALYHAPILLGSVGGLAGLTALVLGRSAKTAANAKQQAASRRGAATNALLALMMPLFVVVLLSAISLATTEVVQRVQHQISADTRAFWSFTERLQTKATGEGRVEHVKTTAVEQGSVVTKDRAFNVIERTDEKPALVPAVMHSIEHLRAVETTTPRMIGAFLVMLVAALFVSLFIGVNTFSMHALYRNRLIRAYLGASRFHRDPDAFTGFDPYDNLQMHELRPELLWANSFVDPNAFIKDLLSDIPEAERGVSATARRRVGAVLQAISEMRWGGPAAQWAVRFSQRAPEEAGPEAAESDHAAISRIVWDALQIRTRGLLQDVSEDDPLPSGCVEALFQDMNRLICSDMDLGAAVGSPATPGPGKAPLSVYNRRILEMVYAGKIIRMPGVSLHAKEGAASLEGEVSSGAQAPSVAHRPPLHVVNVALNLVSGDKLAWQQRKAESFTLTPYHCGSAFLGYRESRTYGGDGAGVSLGTAVTISGAAASPNMGYHSSPAMAFILTLFNVRLGWWLGNPGPAGDSTFEKGNPGMGIHPLLLEALGKTDDAYPWVYLSDGGHFENLGLYEMVLRRCHHIVVSDAGCDPTYAFDDLGNAVRKVRTDFGVPIEIEKIYMHGRGMDKKGKYCALGRIRYTAVDGPNAKDGVLLYIKPGIYDEAWFPKDVFNYAQGSQSFPHESTANQWFTESQFESYRALGRHVIDEILGNYTEDPGKIARLPVAKKFDGVQAFVAAVHANFTPPENLVEETREILSRWM